MDSNPSMSDAGGLGVVAEDDITVLRRLVAHLAPSDSPFRSRHGYFTPEGRPIAVLPRPDVLLLEVMRNQLAILHRFSADGEACGVTCSDLADNLMEEAAQEYGAENVGPWEEVPEGEADASAFAVRQAEARRRGPLGQGCDRMSDEEWWRSDDVPAMIRSLRAGWHGPSGEFVRLIHRYLLASCRAIWRLLPMDESRRGVEVAERYIEGRATAEELRIASWQAEGAAFYLEPFEYEPENEDSEAREHRLRYEAERKARIRHFMADVEAIPTEELRRMVRLDPADGPVDARQVLSDAAYFAYEALDYHLIHARSHSIQSHEAFLDPVLLREIVGDPSARQGLRS